MSQSGVYLANLLKIYLEWQWICRIFLKQIHVVIQGVPKVKTFRATSKMYYNNNINNNTTTAKIAATVHRVT